MRVSFYPWIINNGHYIPLQFYSLLNTYFTSLPAQLQYNSFATFFIDRKGLRRIVQNTEKWLFMFKATAEPIDLPNKIICSDVNLR